MALALCFFLEGKMIPVKILVLNVGDVMALLPLCLSWQGLPGETWSQKELQDSPWRLGRMVRVSFSFHGLQSLLCQLMKETKGQKWRQP